MNGSDLLHWTTLYQEADGKPDVHARGFASSTNNLERTPLSEP
jgi:hypothetical protein